jgi:hypothetical protein
VIQVTKIGKKIFFKTFSDKAFALIFAAQISSFFSSSVNRWRITDEFGRPSNP